MLNFGPGITDPASLRYWTEGELLARVADPAQAYLTRIVPDKVRIQLEYAESATFASDLGILATTINTVAVRAASSVVDSVVRYRRPIILSVHVLLVVIGLLLAFNLRFEFALGDLERRQLLVALPILLGIRLLT